MDPTSLNAEVDAAYARLEPPSWPDLHAHSTASHEEFSRVTDPQRLRIALLRARCWAQVLGRRPGIAVEPVEDELLGDRFDRGLRTTSQQAGTLPILLLEHDGDVGDDTPEVRACLERPDLELETLAQFACRQRWKP